LTPTPTQNSIASLSLVVLPKTGIPTSSTTVTDRKETSVTEPATATTKVSIGHPALQPSFS